MLFWLNFYLLKKLLYFTTKSLGLRETSLLIGKTYTYSQKPFYFLIKLVKNLYFLAKLAKKNYAWLNFHLLTKSFFFHG